jgi:hypothetical protein
MAKLYMIAVDYNAPLVPTFLPLPKGLREGVVEVLDLDKVKDMDDDELHGIVANVVKELGKLRDKAADSSPSPSPSPSRTADRFSEPPRGGHPFTDANDPDAWRGELL